MTSEKAYITILGRSVWAMVNTYYAVLREGKFLPDEIHIFTEKMFTPNIENGRKGLEALNREYGISPSIDVTIVDNVDFVNAGKQISGTIERLKSQEKQIALDITPGRKALVAGALVPAITQNLEHIYYLEITDISDASKPYMMIPLKQQNLWDLTRMVGG